MWRIDIISKRIKKLLLISLIVLSILGVSQGQVSMEQKITQNETVSRFAAYQRPLSDVELHAVLSAFEKYAEKSRKDWQVPGMAVAIVRGNDTIYMHSFGVRNISGSDPVTNDTIFQIGSTSKAFTSALVAMQVDDGNISWNDKVVDHLPDFMMYDPWVTREFTITDLTAQDSGLPSYAGDQLAIMGYNRSYIKHAVRYLKPVTSFRSSFAYQNNMFLWAAEVVENKTGRSWEDNVHDSIFLPLNMTNSTTGMKSFQQAKNVASLHVMDNGTVRALPMNWKYLDWVYTYGPAGGINSNIIDMTKWIRLQMNNGTFEGKRLINASSVQYMHSPKTIISPIAPEFPPYYCQGWIYQQYRPYPVVWHNGGTSGHHSMVAFMPEAKIGIVVLSNAGYTELPEALAFRFFDMYFGSPARDWSAEYLSKSRNAQNMTNASMPVQLKSPSPALPLEMYVGNYENEIYGQINVTAIGSNLVATAGPVKAQTILQPWNRDIFKASTPDLYDYAGFASFYIGLDGRADSVTMDEFNDATFNRV